MVISLSPLGATVSAVAPIARATPTNGAGCLGVPLGLGSWFVDEDGGAGRGWFRF